MQLICTDDQCTYALVKLFTEIHIQARLIEKFHCQQQSSPQQPCLRIRAVTWISYKLKCRLSSKGQSPASEN